MFDENSPPSGGDVTPRDSIWVGGEIKGYGVSGSIGLHFDGIECGLFLGVCGLKKIFFLSQFNNISVTNSGRFPLEKSQLPRSCATQGRSIIPNVGGMSTDCCPGQRVSLAAVGSFTCARL